MPTFDDREKGFENKFAHDKELEFKVEVRRNKMLGEWAAGLMGIAAKDVAAYVASVVESDFKEPGDEDVFVKVWADLKAKKAKVTEAELRKKMTDLLTAARTQVMKE